MRKFIIKKTGEPIKLGEILCYEREDENKYYRLEVLLTEDNVEKYIKKGWIEEQTNSISTYTIYDEACKILGTANLIAAMKILNTLRENCPTAAVGIAIKAASNHFGNHGDYIIYQNGNIKSVAESTNRKWFSHFTKEEAEKTVELLKNWFVK